MSLNGFNLAQSNPQPEGNHVTRSNSRAKKGGNPKKQNLSPMGVRSSIPNRSSVLMMDMMNLLITPLAMKESMNPIVRIVLHQKVNH